MTRHARSLIGLMALFGLILTAVPIYAGPPEGGFGPKDPEAFRQRMEARKKAIHTQLNLTEDQEARLEANRSEHRQEVRKLREKMRAAREAFKGELEKEALDMEKITQLHNEQKTVQGQIADHRLEKILQVREILTPEQFKTFIELTGKHRRDKHRAHRWGKD